MPQPEQKGQTTRYVRSPEGSYPSGGPSAEGWGVSPRISPSPSPFEGEGDKGGEGHKYLYCIIRCPEERTFDGVSPIAAPCGPVYTIPHPSGEALAAVVSDSPVQEYESTRTNMLAHQRVTEEVMHEFTLLPVRFGTVTRDPASALQDIGKLLERRSREFDALLDEMEGKAELGLKALWRDEKAIFGEIVAENPDVRRLRNSLAGKPTAVVRYEGVELGELVKAALDRKKRKEAAAILAPLRRLATRIQENELVMDRMIVNAAFLADKVRGEEFDKAVRRLDEELGERVMFRYVGPVPPYNFVSIVVNWEDL